MTLITKMEVRYCEDCRFYRMPEHCAHPEAHTDNMVSRAHAEALCKVARTYSCGKEARFFEPKPIVEKVRVNTPRRLTWWQRLTRAQVNGTG